MHKEVITAAYLFAQEPHPPSPDWGTFDTAGCLMTLLGAGILGWRILSLFFSPLANTFVDVINKRSDRKWEGGNDLSLSEAEMKNISTEAKKEALEIFRMARPDLANKYSIDNQD